MRFSAVSLLLSAVASLSAAAEGSAPAQPGAYLGSDPRTWGSPHVIVAPDYPPEALAHNVTGTVQVTGVVAPMGRLTDIAYSVDPPEATELVAALKPVIGLWVFYPPVAKDCLPASARVHLNVWFEIRDGEPHISVSRGQAPPPPRPPTPWLKPLERPEPRFPRQMIREGRESHVYARMEVDAGGKVTRVVARAFPVMDGVDLSPFETESEEALTQWRFPPAPEGTERVRVICWDIIYRLRN